MQFLYLLEKIRNPVFDFFFSLITHIGEETVFLLVAILFYWCISKREGLYILVTGLIGTVVNQFLKITFRIERPFDIDPDFTYVESAYAEAKGYSFPSGHTQNVTGTFGAIGRFSSKKWVRISSVVLIILVAFSRMYLGVHTPLDVVVSLLIGAVLVFALYPVFSTEERMNKYLPYVLIGSFVLTLSFLIYTTLLSPEGLNPKNYDSARDNAYALFGCVAGISVAYPIDRKYIKFDTRGVWYSQFIKLAVGLAIVFLIKSTFGGMLEMVVGLFTDSPRLIARAIRYFIIVIFAALVWPLTFKFFSGLRIGFMDRFTDKVAGWYRSVSKKSTENQ